MAPLVGLALVLIAGLILVFLRTFSDLLLTLTGLVFSLMWVIGAEGWLGPNGLGWIGPPSPLTIVVPIIVISLTVDYAIQAVSHYRERRADGEPVTQAVRTGLRSVAVPLALAAVTTIASFLATLFSPIEVIADFGIVAGLGVGLSVIVMLTLVPAGRTIIDRRRESRGKLAPPRPVSSALPGVERAAELLGAGVARRPAPYLIAVAGVTIGLGFAATGLESEFSIRDILPRNGSVLNDMETLDAAVGGSTELASVLVRAEATETRTLLNVQDLTTAFEDEQRRPRAAAGPMEASYESLVRDWTDDSGESGDKYDPELAALFRKAAAGVQLDAALMQEFLDMLGARDPALARGLVNNPDGIDAILGPSRIRGIEGCWHRLGSLCHEDAAGFEVAWVGEPVGASAQDLEQVVGSLDSAVGGPVAVVPVEDLVGPCDERVDGVVVLGQLAGLVEVAEPPEGFEGAVIVVGGVEAVELLQGLPAGFEAGVGVEQLVEAGAVGVGEGVASAQQREPGTEHLGVEGGLDAFGLAALDVAADLGERGREPSDDVEPVQHMAGVAEVGVDGRLVGPRSVADHDLDALAPSVALLRQER